MTRGADRLRSAGLVAGPLLAALAFTLLPLAYRDASGELASFTFAGRATLALMLWMAIWWLSEAVHISVTALLPVVVLPLVTTDRYGTASEAIAVAAAPYAHPLIFLFAGGFLLGLSMQRWGLDRRIALVTLRLVGTRSGNVIGGLMLATAAMSAFVSNTATAAMMLPIAMSVIALVRSRPEAGEVGDFAIALLLGIAYAASIGGISTIIGSPPNAILVAFLASTIDAAYRTEISFVEWLAIGLPIAGILLPTTWLLLTRVLHRPRFAEIPGGAGFVRASLAELGPPSRGEWATLVAFSLTALAWITRPLLVELEVAGLRPLAGLSDPVIAMLGGGSLFLIPVSLRERRFVMDWATARQLEWGVLVLFGGGLSLATAVGAHGVAEFIGSRAAALGGLPEGALVGATVTGMIFLTELTSNTASTATLVPILSAVAIGFSVHPYLLVVPATLAASCAFMMPVATPPNAIVFASGELRIGHMIRAGLILNGIGIGVVTAMTYLWIDVVLGV